MSEHTVYLRGEGGAVQTMDLAAFLHPGLRRRIRRGELTRVNPDGSPWAEPAPDQPGPPDNPDGAGGPEGETGQHGDPDDGTEQPADPDGDGQPADAPPLPPRSASRAVWAEFAIGQGMDREQAAAMSRGELISALVPA